MITLALRLLVTALALMVAAEFIPGISVENIYAALVAAIVLGLLNILVRPVLIFFTLPITLLTLGLFIFVINGLMFWAAASFVQGFTVDGFLPAFIGSLFVTLVSTLAHKFIS